MSERPSEGIEARAEMFPDAEMLVVEPGDILILRLGDDPGDEMIERTMDALDGLGLKGRYMLMGGDVQLGVVRSDGA